jgi:hypothetical protein
VDWVAGQCDVATVNRKKCGVDVGGWRDSNSKIGAAPSGHIDLASRLSARVRHQQEI